MEPESQILWRAIVPRTRRARFAVWMRRTGIEYLALGCAFLFTLAVLACAGALLARALLNH
jgi:hypothetical protein